MLLFMDGLDCYDSANDLQASGAISFTNSNFSFEPTSGRFGGGALAGYNNGGNFGQGQFFQTLALNKDYIFGFSFKINAAETSTTRSLLTVNDGSGNQILGVNLKNGGILEVRNASDTSIASSAAGVIVAGAYVRIELKFNMGTSASTGSCDLHVNGTSVVSLTGQNFFRAGGGANITLSNPNTFGVTRYFDDLTFNDTTGTVNNDFLGDIRIDTLKPSGDTVQKDWTLSAGTAGYALIDDPNGASDGDTSYISSQVVGNKSEFALSNIIGQSSAINAVQTRVKAKKTDVGTRRYRAYLKSGSAVANGPEISPPVGLYSWPTTNGLQELDPNGSVAWTDAAINNLQLGLELTA